MDPSSPAGIVIDWAKHAGSLQLAELLFGFLSAFRTCPWNPTDEECSVVPPAPFLSISFLILSCSAPLVMKSLLTIARRSRFPAGICITFCKNNFYQRCLKASLCSRFWESAEFPKIVIPKWGPKNSNSASPGYLLKMQITSHLWFNTSSRWFRSTLKFEQHWSKTYTPSPLGVYSLVREFNISEKVDSSGIFKPRKLMSSVSLNISSYQLASICHGPGTVLCPTGPPLTMATAWGENHTGGS